MVTLKVIFGIAFGGILIVLLILFFLTRYLKNKHTQEIQTKNSEIELLNKKNKKLDLYKYQSEISPKAEINQWFENSKKALLNAENLPRYEAQIIQEEIKKRQKLKTGFSFPTAKTTFTMEKIEGTYSIIGLNQNQEQNCYNGFLHLTKSGEYRVNAEWVIGGEQTQVGVGFYHNHTLVINFSYEGELENIPHIFKGVVVYKFINKTILTGFWSEKYGDDKYLGFEEGRKLSNSESISYQAKMN